MTSSPPRPVPARATGGTRRLLRGALLAVTWLVVGGLALAVLGAFQPSAPAAIGVVGSFFVPMASPWVVLLALAGLALAMFCRRLGATRGGTVLGALAALTAIGAGVVTVRMANAAPNADVSILAAFSVGAPGDGPDATRVYTTIDNRPLRVDVYRPRKAAPDRRLPALVYVHGGGWIKNSRADLKSNHRWLADRGYIVLSVDYRLAAHGRPTWDLAVADVGCALTWMRRNADDLGIDLARGFALAGDSSGGQLAINTAYTAATNDARTSCGGRVPQAAAVITLYPAVDPAAIYRTSKAGDISAAAHDFTEKFIGGTPDAVPARYRAAASSTYISRDAPPTLIVAPDNDHILPAEAPRRFARAARAAGVDVDLIRMPYADHGFDLPFNSIGNQVRRSLTLKFLRRHLQ